MSSKLQSEQFVELESRNTLFKYCVKTFAEYRSTPLTKASIYTIEGMANAIKDMQKWHIKTLKNIGKGEREYAEDVEKFLYHYTNWENYKNSAPNTQGIIESVEKSEERENLLWLESFEYVTKVKISRPRLDRQHEDAETMNLWIEGALKKYHEYIVCYEKHKREINDRKITEKLKGSVKCEVCGYSGKLFSHKSLVCPDCFSILNITRNKPDWKEG